MGRWTFGPRKWPLAVLPLGALYFLDGHIAPLWVLPGLERTTPRELSVLQGQELIVEGVSIPPGTPLTCCRSGGDLDLDLTFERARLAAGSAETFRTFLNQEPPGGLGRIRYLSHPLDPAGESCRTSFSLETGGARLRTLRLSQPEPPPSDSFRVLRIRLPESGSRASLQTASGPGAGTPGLGCRKRLRIGTTNWDFYAPLSHEIDVASGGDIRFRLERLPPSAPGLAESAAWPVDLLQGVEATAVRIVDAAERPTEAFESRRGRSAIRIDRLKLRADRMIVAVEVPSLRTGFESQPALVGGVIVLLVAVNGGLVLLGARLALSGIERRPRLSRVQIFVSYSHKDAEYLQEIALLEFLGGLKGEGVDFWTDQDIPTGSSWDDTILEQIRRSDIALLLVSQSYLDSVECNKEVRAFLDQKTVLVPVILSPCEWQRHEWLKKPQFLPSRNETLKENYKDSNRRERLFLRLKEDLRKNVEKIRQKKGPRRRMRYMPTFFEARDLLLRHRDDYEAAVREFRWPDLKNFNWALDYFDAMARGNPRVALHLVDDAEAEEKITFDEMSGRSNRAANFLRAAGVRRGDRILIMLGNVAPLWEITLAAIKLGAVFSPATAMLTTEDLQDRIDRGAMRHVIADASTAAKFADVQGTYTRIAVSGSCDGWLSYAPDGDASFVPEGETRPGDPLLLYFTSGTTAKPKMVLHTHASYPVGHLSTMYWIGLREGDVHWNISSPGWAKHAWSSFFAPWNAGATIFVFNYARFDAQQILAALQTHGVTTLCAPPTVWRMLILEDLRGCRHTLREIVSAGEPLNPEIIERVREAWGITMRDGYGQTETTAQFGNSPGQPVKLGSMGRPLPGYRVALVDADGQMGSDGEIVLDLDPPPLALMAGYLDGEMPVVEAGGQRHYRTSDVAARDEDGYYWYVGRSDDVFKSSDYRISPFEIESALLEHEHVAEAAVVPSPDPLRLAVPKAYVTLKPGEPPTRETARSIFAFVRERLAPYKRVRRIEFAELPKTISGKIRRVQLRAQEQMPGRPKGPNEFWEDDV